MINVVCVSIKHCGRNINIVDAVLRCQQKQTRTQQIKSHYSTTKYESVCWPAQESHSDKVHLTAAVKMLT